MKLVNRWAIRAWKDTSLMPLLIHDTYAWAGDQCGAHQLSMIIVDYQSDGVRS
jgi:hypothetical protein